MLAGDRDRVGEIEFTLAIVVADPLQNGERAAAGERHQAGIAQVDAALGLARIELLADGDERAAVEHQPAVALRVSRPEAEHGQRRTIRERRAHAHQRLRAHERRVGEDHQHIVGRAASAARAANTACAVPLRSACTNI